MSKRVTARQYLADSGVLIRDEQGGWHPIDAGYDIVDGPIRDDDINRLVGEMFAQATRRLQASSSFSPGATCALLRRRGPPKEPEMEGSER